MPNLRPQAVILAGGLGTRLRTVIGNIPKPLASVNGRPFLEFQIDWLKQQGVTRIVLCVGYGRDMILSHLGNGAKYGVDITYSEEEQPLGTGGALLNARGKLDREFLLLNGDTFFDTDVSPLLIAHDTGNVFLTMALVSVADTIRQGAVLLDDQGFVVEFVEKGRHGAGLINAGLYVISQQALGHFPVRTPLSLENDVFPQFVQQRQIRGHLLHGYHIDIGTPESYVEFERYLNKCQHQS